MLRRGVAPQPPQAYLGHRRALLQEHHGLGGEGICSGLTIRRMGAKQRLVGDCRNANQKFRRPTPWRGAEALWRLEMDTSNQVFAAHVDVQNCFSQIERQDWLVPFFSVRRLTLAEAQSVVGNDTAKVRSACARTV